MSLSPRAALPLAALALALAAPAVAQEKQNPIAAEVKAALKDPGKPFTMVIRLKAKEDAAEKFEAAFAKAIGPTRKEKGCLAYDLNRDAKAAGQYLLYERWQDLPSLEAHLQARHITTLLAELKELLAAPPELHVYVPAGD